jgi:D-arabinose 1-dehydrogenase-like Zn-dependent alcohol dehydrogenase
MTADTSNTWVAPVEALAAIPESLGGTEAAPLLCAGITTFNALRHSGALPGDIVAVQGIGGLGHLGIQFASKFGYKVAVSVRQRWRLLLPERRHSISTGRMVRGSPYPRRNESNVSPHY